MKNKIKRLIVAMIFALSAISCEKDKPTPEPPKPPAKAKIELSASEITVMLGLSGEVEIKNVNKLSIKESKKDIAQLNYDPASKKLKINTQNIGEVSFDITDEGNPSYVVTLTVKISPVVFGMLGQDAQMILTANYRYQSPKSLHMASSGADRRKQFIKIPFKTEWKPGEAVNIIYKKDEATPEQQIATTLSQFRDSSGKEKIIYLKTNDGKFIIFPVYKK